MGGSGEKPIVKRAAAGFLPVPADRLEREGFIAAALACGATLPSETPAISNVYDRDRPYDPGEPGMIHWYLDVPDREASLLKALSKVWNDTGGALRATLDEITVFPERILTAATPGERESAGTRLDQLTALSACAWMRCHFSGQAFPQIVDDIVTREEKDAATALDRMPSTLSDHQKNGLNQEARRRKLALELRKIYPPAMAAWVKCWRTHRRLTGGDTWQAHGHRALKINRDPEGRPPLVIPICRDPRKTDALLDRWVGK